MADVAPAAPAPAAAVDPGKGLGIAGLIFAFLFPLVGLILSIVAQGKSKKAGFKNPLATWGLILSIVFMVIGIIVSILFLVLGGAALFGGLAQTCSELGTGVWEVNGVTYTCG